MDFFTFSCFFWNGKHAVTEFISNYFAFTKILSNMNFTHLTITCVALVTFLGCTQNAPVPAPSINSTANPLDPPDMAFGELFTAVQTEKVFLDSKTFPDCTPKSPLSEILKQYESSKNQPGFDLKKFVTDHFDQPVNAQSGYHSDSTQTTRQHIESLWEILTRNPQTVTAGSLLQLPKSYVVPGGRFREIYYWDSFFTMLGLRASGRTDLMENMVANFAHLIDTHGHIPNGSRTYYLSRSQPPFFALMVRLLDEAAPGKTPAERPLVRFLPQMEKELAFWMSGTEKFSGADQKAPVTIRRVVQLEEGILNRYFDDSETPRAESWREDVETAKKSGRPAAEVYRNLKAGAESGWDYSSRWFADGKTLATIHTLDILPVDLNCLIFNLEKTVGEAYQIKGDADKATLFIRNAHLKRELIDQYFWNEQTGFFEDFDLKTNKTTGIRSLAGVFPLYFGLASEAQAASVAKVLEKEFLKPGGFLTTLTNTGQQWDAPNAWPPLQWMAVRGLEATGHKKLAAEAKKRWLAINDSVYKSTGKMMEKYRVDDLTLPGGGGEYPVQDGFGWTNGVYLDFLR